MVSSAVAIAACRAPLTVVFTDPPGSTRLPFVGITDTFVEGRSFVTSNFSPMIGSIVKRCVIIDPIIVQIVFNGDVLIVVGESIQVDPFPVLGIGETR